MQLVLSLNEVNVWIFDDPSDRDFDDYPATYKDWRRGHLKAKAIIGLTLSDSCLEKVQHAFTAKQMCSAIFYAFGKHTWLNQLAARLRFYTAQMHEIGKVIALAARIGQKGGTLKSMSVSLDDN